MINNYTNYKIINLTVEIKKNITDIINTRQILFNSYGETCLFLNEELMKNYNKLIQDKKIKITYPHHNKGKHNGKDYSYNMSDKDIWISVFKEKYVGICNFILELKKQNYKINHKYENIYSLDTDDGVVNKDTWIFHIEI